MTQLQCKDCHPLLGGVVDLGQLPDATDSVAPSVLELQSPYVNIPFMSLISLRGMHVRCCGRYLLQGGCHLPNIQYIIEVFSTALVIMGYQGPIAWLTLVL